jgi:methylenetetrahydrofolate dehydrogenase (NADP+)/methenyltetrahydrofolate cyclohydrolase
MIKLTQSSGGYMETKVISGKVLSLQLREWIANKVSSLKDQGTTPGLAVVLVGEDPASQSYVAGKEKACQELGMYNRDIRLPSHISEEQILSVVNELNADTSIHGILVQLPLPKHVDEQKVIMAIDPQKDVDGFHPVSVGNMVLGQDTFLSCTPHGILKMLSFAGVETKGAEVVVIGRSNIVGKPVSLLLMQNTIGANATVTVCHSRTRDLASHTQRADIIIVATGFPHTLTKEMVRPGTVVIDVGVNRIEDPSKKRGYRLIGDTDYQDLLGIASAITPVPGGSVR